MQISKNLHALNDGPSGSTSTTHLMSCGENRLRDITQGSTHSYLLREVNWDQYTCDRMNSTVIRVDVREGEEQERIGNVAIVIS